MSNVGATMGPIFQLVFTLASLFLLGLFVVKMVPVGIVTMLVMSGLSCYMMYKDRDFWRGVLAKVFK